MYWVLSEKYIYDKDRNEKVQSVVIACVRGHGLAEGAVGAHDQQNLHVEAHGGQFSPWHMASAKQ